MRVAVIGAGRAGRRHVKNLKALGVESIGVQDVDTAKAQGVAAEVGGTVLVSRVSTWQPDAVIIATPADTHAAVALRLVDEGCVTPLMVEKPLALCIEDCRVFAGWGNQVGFVGYNLRFHPIIRAWKAAGPWPRGHFECECDNSKYGNDYFELSHEVDLAHWLCPADPSYKLNGASQKYRRGWAVYSDNAANISVYTDPEALGTEMYRAELAHFLDCAEKNQPTIIPFADGIRVVQICEDALKPSGAQA